jgi:Protein of unknown function (DUF3991)/Toprim-like
MSVSDVARLRAVPLAEVMQRLGAASDPRDKARWKTSRGPVSVTGMRFYNWHASAGGGGAIDLVMHLRGVDFKGAVAWLRNAFGDVCRVDTTSAPPVAHDFQPPARDERMLPRVVRYLEDERAIPHDVLAPLIETKSVHADARGNAVFLHVTSDGRAVGAELRGTTRVQWRGMARGSRKAAGYFAAGPSDCDEIVLCESAIDAISCYALRPGACAISTAGTCSTRPWFGEVLAAGRPVRCGFDTDDAGEDAARLMTARHPEIQRLRPAAHDWNDDLKARRATLAQP